MSDWRRCPTTFRFRLVAALRRAGGSVKYTEYPDVEDDVRTRAYAERELADWLFSQRLGQAAK